MTNKACTFICHNISCMLCVIISHCHCSPMKTLFSTIPKLAVITFMRELGRRLEGSGVTSYSVHPGAVYTPLSSACNSYVSSNWPKVLVQAGHAFQRNIFRTPNQGAQTRSVGL